MHIMLDGKVTANQPVLYHKRSLRGFLVIIASLMGMERLGDVKIEEYKAEDTKVAGLSAVQFVAQSGIYVHTYPEIDFIYLDVFSCKAIPLDAISWITSHLKLKVYNKEINPTRGHIHLLYEGLN